MLPTLILIFVFCYVPHFISYVVVAGILLKIRIGECHLGRIGISKFYQELMTIIRGTFHHVACEAGLEPSAYDLPTDGEPLDESGMWQAVYGLLSLLIKDIPLKQTDPPLDPDGEMIRYVAEHFCEGSMSLTQLGERFGLSVSSASKAFKSASGTNFHEYVTALRMEHAKRLLKISGNSIEFVAREVGYLSEYSFRRAFIRHSNMRPREYAEQCASEKQ